MTKQDDKKVYKLKEISKFVETSKNESEDSYVPTLKKILTKNQAKIHTIGKPKDETVEDMYNHLVNEAVKANCLMEIEVYVARLERRISKLQRYFNSTPLRQIFARVLVLGRSTNRLYTISEICDVLQASRQAVSKMVEETEAEGWCRVYRDNNRVQVQASGELYSGHVDYTLWRKELARTITLPPQQDLIRFTDLMSSYFTHEGSETVKPDDIDNEFKDDNI